MMVFIRKAWPLVLFFLSWDLICRGLKIPPYIVPPPYQVLQRIVDSWRLLYQHSLISFIEIASGFGIAAIGGFLLAVAMVHSHKIEAIFEPFLVISQVVPKVALAPLFIIWFGHGLPPKIIIAALIAFFPVLINSVVGLRAVDAEIVELMDSIAATKRQIFWHVRLPSSLPYILPSLKVAILLSIVGAMVGEFVGSDKGLGYLMIEGDVNLDTDLLFAALIVVTAFGLLMYSMIELVETVVGRRYGKSADLPPLKWSSLKYDFRMEDTIDGKEEAYG